jgi:hypothetical protein
MEVEELCRDIYEIVLLLAKAYKQGKLTKEEMIQCTTVKLLFLYDNKDSISDPKLKKQIYLLLDKF